MENEIDPRKIIGMLADVERFRVLAAVSLGAGTLEKITDMTGHDNATVMKALLKLEEAGLITKKESGYVFNAAVMQALNRSISQSLPKKPALTGIDRFFKDGKLITYPKDHEDKMAVLGHIIALFETGREYAEKEVNEKLKEVNPDYASYRRYLTDAGFFSREQKADESGRTVTYYRRAMHL
jgi:hypothetical protein